MRTGWAEDPVSMLYVSGLLAMGDQQSAGQSGPLGVYGTAVVRSAYKWLDWKMFKLIVISGGTMFGDIVAEKGWRANVAASVDVQNGDIGRSCDYLDFKDIAWKQTIRPNEHTPTSDYPILKLYSVH